MRLKQILLALIVGAVLSVALWSLGPLMARLLPSSHHRLVNLIFLFLFPGYLVASAIWGIHNVGYAPGSMVVVYAVDALEYAIILYALYGLVHTIKRSKQIQ